MHILILNGSPKGKYSITLHTSLYLEQCFPKHTFEVLHIGQRIRVLSEDFTPALEALQRADLIIFSYPVYTFIAPYQMHRFIELVKESGIDLSGKFATQISTSKHFYDVTAHRYIEDNCYDLGLKYIRGLSADMDDLTKPQGRKEAREFFKYVLWSIKTNSYEPAPAVRPEFTPIIADVPESTAAKTLDKEVVIVTNCVDEDTQLQQMIARFQAVLPANSRVVNIGKYPFSGGCLGCFNCAVDGKCIYKDNFDEYLRNDIQTGDAIVYAFSIKDHSMGASFKLYDDRQFCNGHRTVTMGMPMGYIVSGDYEGEANLKMIIEGRAQVGGNFLAGVATDEKDTNHAIDRMAASLSYALKNKLTQPQNFYGIGGMKIFRDLIFQMQGMMRADHKFYKAHGQYDFPQKHMGRVAAMYLVGAMMASPKIKKKMGNKMNEGMIMPYKKVLEKAKKEQK